MHAASGLSPVCCTPTIVRLSACRVLVASDLTLVHSRMGIRLSWSSPPPASMDVGLLLRVGSIPLTIDQSGILPRVGYVPSTMGRSVFGVFFKGFCLGTRSSPPACYCAFTIFSWKLGIVVVSDNTFQYRNHSVGALLLALNYCWEVRQ